MPASFLSPFTLLPWIEIGRDACRRHPLAKERNGLHELLLRGLVIFWNHFAQKLHETQSIEATLEAAVGATAWSAATGLMMEAGRSLPNMGFNIALLSAFANMQCFPDQVAERVSSEINTDLRRTSRHEGFKKNLQEQQRIARASCACGRGLSDRRQSTNTKPNQTWKQQVTVHYTGRLQARWWGLESGSSPKFCIWFRGRGQAHPEGRHLQIVGHAAQATGEEFDSSKDKVQLEPNGHEF